MSKVLSVDKDHGHDKTINNTSNIITLKPRLTNDKNTSDLDTTVKEVQKELRKLLIKRKELITKLGNAFESVVANPESVCEEIKNILRDEIRDKIISARDIERYCPDKWKKKTKPKNDNLSFSDKQVEGKSEQQIAVTRDGKSVIMSDTEAHPRSSNGDNEPHDQSKQNAIGTNANNEERTADAELAHLLNDERVSRQKENLTDTKKEVLISHISMPFEDLRKDMAAVFQTTKGIGNIFFKVWVDLGTLVVRIKFCGITQENEMGMSSTGESRMLKEGN